MHYEHQAAEAAERFSRSARSLPITFAGLGGLLISGRVVLYGWSLANSATTANTLTVYDGLDNTGNAIAVIPVPAGGNNLVAPTDPGIRCERGLYLVRQGSAVSGSLYVADASEIGWGHQRRRELTEVEVLAVGTRGQDVPGGISDRHLANQPGYR